MTEKIFNRSRFARIMSYESYVQLEKVTETERTIRYVIPMSKFFTASRPSRLLTQCIIKYAKGVGHHAKENTQGSLRKERGKWKFQYGGGSPGEEDITYYPGDGTAIALEIKYGPDRQSEAQKKYEERMKKVGIRYEIIKTFDEFLTIVQ